MVCCRWLMNSEWFSFVYFAFKKETNKNIVIYSILRAVTVGASPSVCSSSQITEPNVFVWILPSNSTIGFFDWSAWPSGWSLWTVFVVFAWYFHFILAPGRERTDASGKHSDFCGRKSIRRLSMKLLLCLTALAAVACVVLSKHSK